MKNNRRKKREKLKKKINNINRNKKSIRNYPNIRLKFRRRLNIINNYIYSDGNKIEQEKRGDNVKRYYEQKYDGKTLPKNVELAIHYLRDICGDGMVFEKSFDVKYSNEFNRVLVICRKTGEILG